MVRHLLLALLLLAAPAWGAGVVDLRAVEIP